MNLLCETSIEIRCVLPDTFNYITDLDNFNKWFPEVIEFESIDDKPIGTIGKQYSEKLYIEAGVEEQITVEVIDFVQNQRLVTQSELHPILPRMTIVFSKVDQDHTKIVWRMDSRNTEENYVKETLPVVQNIISERATIALNNLKRILE